MAFQEASHDDLSFTESEIQLGLNFKWYLAAQERCPICCDDLVYFNHVGLWKCPCGVKISNHSIEVLKSLKKDDFDGRLFFGNYEDETPF